MTTRKFANRPIHQPVPSERIESGPDLPDEEAVLARDLINLAQTIQPDAEFVARLEGELARKRPAPRPAPQYSYSLLQNLRAVLQSAWGWTLPVGAVILLILAISLLVQMRPRHVIPSSVLTSTAQFVPTAPPTPLPSPTATIYVVQEGDTLLKIADRYGVPVAAIYEANPVLSEGVLRPGLELIIPLEARSAYTPGVLPQASTTPVHVSATPASTAEALLAELDRLVEPRRVALLTGPGWIYVESDRTDTEQGGKMLPNGRQVPPQYMEYSWYQVDEKGNVLASITRQIDYSDQIYQVIVNQNGIARNMTFSFENTAPLTTPYETDRGFAANAAQALARGATLRQAGSDDGNFVLLLEEDDLQRGGNLQKYATFDPQTGHLLELSTWLDVPCGDTEFDCGGGLLESMTLMVEQRVDQPPADVLALLGQPLPEYQPVPPQGEPVPPDFDLAHSRLNFQTFAGDDFYNPTFWYGDIYADSSYLVGRVDFGAVQGGFCQRSPDGLKLAIDRATFPTDAPAVHQLRWLALSSPGEVQAVLPDLQLVSPPVWSPGSDRLAFIACDAVQNCGLYTYDILSGGLQRLAEAGNATPPVWSPGGVEIAYQNGSGEAPQTVVVDAVSGMVIASPGWQPAFLADWGGYSQCELTPALAPTLPEAPTVWLVYTNPDYGFSFRYSPDWRLEALTHTVQLVQGEVYLTIGFRHSGEEATNQRTGVAAGDILPAGHVSFLGQSLPRFALVYESKVKAILYSLGIQTVRGDLVFTLSLDDFSPDYDAVDLSAELQQLMDQVIESFAWIQSGEPGITPTVEPSKLLVTAQEAWVPIYSGPGSQFLPVGELAQGALLAAQGLSADGSWIAFDRPGFVGTAVWISAAAVTLSGGALDVVSAPPVPVSAPLPPAPPTTMKTAGRIAFISKHEGYPVLYAMNADGSGLTVLVSDLGNLMEPFWSPDGQTLAFDATSQQTHDIATFVVGADGGAWSEVATSTYLDWAHRRALSPDGTRMVYVEGSVFVSDADGSNPINLSGNDPNRSEASFPVWSPDGSQIAYISWLVDENGWTVSTDLFIVAADGTQSNIQLASWRVVPSWPSWSPDGQYIAYAMDGDIYAVRLGDGQIWRLTEDPTSDYAPAWNPSTSLAPLPGSRPDMPAMPSHTAGDEQLAHQALLSFLDSMQTAQYTQAAVLYGGDYSVLVEYNWDIDPRDKAALLHNACQGNGFQCLPLRSASLVARNLPDTYVFVVEFENPDGSLFEQGPCCGGSEADFPSVSQFEFVVVKKAEGKFVVLQLPPLMP